jgi:hypothetical protein
MKRCEDIKGRNDVSAVSTRNAQSQRPRKRECWAEEDSEDWGGHVSESVRNLSRTGYENDLCGVLFAYTGRHGLRRIGIERVLWTWDETIYHSV